MAPGASQASPFEGWSRPAMRLFAAVVPPPEAIEDLAAFLEPREEAGPDLRWTTPEQWHLTLAFMRRGPWFQGTGVLKSGEIMRAG